MAQVPVPALAGQGGDLRRLDAYPGKVASGRIDCVYPYLDTRLHTRTVEIDLDEDISLLPGMFARRALTLKSAEAAVVVPLEALVNTPAGRMVFVFEDEKAMAREVETGIEADNRIAILSGIEPGDKVIVAGNGKLKNGVEVRQADNRQAGQKAGQDPGYTFRRAVCRERRRPMKITRYAVGRRLATCAIVLALVVLGLYGLWRLPVDLLPDITYPLVKIQIK